MARLSTLLVALSAGFAYAQSSTPDPAFGTNGRVLSHFGSAYNEAFAVAIQADGKIMVAVRCGAGAMNSLALFTPYELALEQAPYGAI